MVVVDHEDDTPAQVGMRGRGAQLSSFDLRGIVQGAFRTNDVESVDIRQPVLHQQVEIVPGEVAHRPALAVQHNGLDQEQRHAGSLAGDDVRRILGLGLSPGRSGQGHQKRGDERDASHDEPPCFVG